YIIPTPYTSTLFPYTTLFRSSEDMRYTTSIELKNECSFWLRMKLEHLMSKHCPEKILEEIEYCCNIPEIIQAVNYPKEDNSGIRSEEHTSELQSRFDLVCRLL